ncbi:MAG: hypothetical protein ABJF10_02095 [Chthoniobacter sp.]|uniref:hypothetical protein n=1 Tax=Chthoniobacter sp. TaxID=2510640 RepID=UPI0032A26DEF
MSPKSFVIYFQSGELRTVEAPSMRTALRHAEKALPKDSIVAAVEADCLPMRQSDEVPFLAVFLKNPHFTAPEVPEA